MRAGRIAWPLSYEREVQGQTRTQAEQRGLGLRNFYIFANLASEKIVDLSMAGNGRRFADREVHLHRVTSAFTEKLDTMTFQVADQIDPFHEIEARGSRITVLFRRDSSASARFDSNTSWTAS